MHLSDDWDRFRPMAQVPIMGHDVLALRQRFLEDLRSKRLQTKTMYLRAMRTFPRYLGPAPDIGVDASFRPPPSRRSQ
ncbi:hypothetical protein So717_20310 [Roseobacter cerasinus]|uniref:Uncharacterized protein n=1 Tax=Roseobacter cerasinus TaxID=2602289 RepID=A0A640VPB6_9RHOB|nr:hypothetical protein So717_20310 [Roseobacter cerasinus]